MADTTQTILPGYKVIAKCEFLGENSKTFKYFTIAKGLSLAENSPTLYVYFLCLSFRFSIDFIRVSLPMFIENPLSSHFEFSTVSISKSNYYE